MFKKIFNSNRHKPPTKPSFDTSGVFDSHETAKLLGEWYVNHENNQRAPSREIAKTEQSQQVLKQLLQSLPQHLLRADSDPTGELLKSLANSQFDPLELEALVSSNDTLMDLVRSNLYDQALANYQHFVHGMQLINELSSDLAITAQLITSSRRDLAQVHRNMIISTFDVLFKRVRCKRIKSVHVHLSLIKTISSNEFEIGNLCSKGLFVDAILLHRETLSLLPDLPDQIVCAKKLKKRISSETLGVINNWLLNSLRKHTQGFNDESFDTVLCAYSILGILPSLSDQLSTQFTGAIDSISKSIVMKYCPQVSKNSDFRDLCVLISVENFCELFLEFLKSLALLLYSFSLVCRHVNNFDASILPDGCDIEEALAIVKSQEPEIVSIQDKLWDFCQQRVGLLIGELKINSTNVKVEEFVIAINALDQFILFGSELVSTQTSLLPIVHRVCKSYFDSLHAETLGFLKMAMDSDTWMALPIHEGFKLSSREIRSATRSDLTLLEQFSRGDDIFSAISIPFERHCDTDIVSLPAHSVARAIFKYISIMKALRPVALNAFNGITELFDFYFYSIFVIFGPAAMSLFKEVTKASSRYPSLCTAITNISNRLSKQSFASGFFTDLVPPFFAPVELNSSTLLNSKDSLYGVIHRVVAFHSLSYLVKILKDFQADMSAQLLPAARSQVFSFTSYADDVIEQSYRFLYRNLAPYMIDLNTTTKQLKNSSWDSSSISGSHGSYVDTLLVQVTLWDQKMHELSNLPSYVRQRLWTEICIYIFEELTEYYSQIKRLSNEGKAQISLDLTVIRSGLTAQTDAMNLKLSDDGSLHGWNRIDVYVRALYFRAADDLHEWIRSQGKAFSLQQVLWLASNGVGAEVKKREKESFMNNIQSIYNEVIE